MLCSNLCYKVSLKSIFKTSKKYEVEKLPFKEWTFHYKKDGSYYVKTMNMNIKKVLAMFSKDGWSKEMFSFKTLQKRYDQNTIVQMVKKKTIALIPCGKCEFCMQQKQNADIRRVKAQFKKSEFCYFLTFTLSNDQIRLVVPEHQRENYKAFDPTNLSYLSTLSKLDDANITKNLKNKLRRYYGNDKVKFHYYMCGEYGSTTKRAHYHMLLMLNVPIPDLVRERTKKEIYRSKMISSKQFGMYMLEKCDKKDNCAKYISKYMTKESNKSGTVKLNRFQEMQQHYYLASKNYDPNYRLLLVKNPKMLLLLYLCPLDFVEIYFPCVKNFRSSAFCDAYQKEYTRKSRMLGISSNYEQCYIDNVLNAYYYKKFKISQLIVLGIYLKLFVNYVQGQIAYEQVKNWLYLYLYYLILDKQIQIRRAANIEKYLFLPQKTQNTTKYSKNNDIF